MDIDSLYQSKLTTPDQAVAAIPSGQSSRWAWRWPSRRRF